MYVGSSSGVRGGCIVRRPLDVTFRPIDRWPGEPTPKREPSRFKAGWGATLEQLQKELAHLGSESVVVMLSLTEDDIRLDGWPRANARPSHPGVVLAFDSREYGPLKYPCDNFTTWQDNLRAIALALEALRKVDRYGVTKRGEQYTGWKALPGSGGTSSTMTAEAAAAFLSEACRGDCSAAALLQSVVNVVPAYRAAARRLHPDAGGSTEEFQRLQTAKAVLDAHHGGRP